jgi:hypothetical protein
VKDYTIDKVSWHTRVEGNPESPEDVKKRFRVLVRFLQENRLTVRQLLSDEDEVRSDFGIRTSDLTNEGCQVMKASYDKWLKQVTNRRKDSGDLGILHQALVAVRRS